MTIALVSGQTAANFVAGVNSITVTLPVNPSTGNFVVALFAWIGNSAATFTVKDGNNNSYTQTTSSPFNDNTLGNEYIIAYLPNVPSNGNKSITFSTSVGGADSCAFAAEFSGVATSSLFDTDATLLFSSSTSGTSITTPTVTTAVNGELIVNITSVGTTLTAANSPWNGIGTAQDSSLVWAGYQIQSTAGSGGPNYTAGSTTQHEGITAAFKPAAGGGASVTPWRRQNLVYRRY